MTKNYTCIICPQGCDMRATIEDKNLITLEGNKCSKGEEYIRQELTDPMRNIATSVLVIGGELPLASVRLNKPVPKGKIFDIMAEAKTVCLTAPVRIGQIAVKNTAGTGADLVVTKNVGKPGETPGNQKP